MSHLITPRLIPDHAVEKTDKDGLGFEVYAKTFARLIAAKDSPTPLVIGVHGRWGSGKTTLLKLIKAYVDQLKTPNDLSQAKFLNADEDKASLRCCRTVWFNAWQYSDEEELLVALMRVVVQTMCEDDFIAKSLGKILDPFRARRDVINTVFSWFAIKAPLPGLPFVEFKPNPGVAIESPFAKKIAFLDQFSPAFDRLLAAWAHKSLTAKKIDPAQGVVVIFIDDLDRCLPDKTVQVLEAIKLFLDRTGVVFVLAADVDVVRSAVEAHYEKAKIKDQRAEDYLEKIFQVRFPLPPLAHVHIQGYLSSLAMEDAYIQDRLELINAISENNPRQVKTFLNDAEIGWAILQNSGQAEGLEQKDFLSWLALTRVNDRFTNHVRGLGQAERMKYLMEAIDWARDLSDPALGVQFNRWATDTRLQAVLRAVQFSNRVNPESLEKLIFWSDIEELAQRRLEERRRKQEERESLRLLEISKQEEQRRLDLQRQNEDEKRQGVYFLKQSNYWVQIPAGTFVMGSAEHDEAANDIEKPQHTVEIPYTYYMARYPVTTGEFARYLREAQNYTLYNDHLEHPDHPAVRLSFADALAYCEWLQKTLQGIKTFAGFKVRLPTEAEWEKAARGVLGARVFPWGDEFESGECNTSESGFKLTTPVGQYSPQGDSPYGLADMSGNVYEWCQSKYKPYPYRANDGREVIDTSEEVRVVRGGAFHFDQRVARCAFRLNPPPNLRSGFVGFRVVLAPVIGLNF